MNRFLILSTLVAVTSAAGALAEVVSSPDLTATGRVVSTGNASLVLQIDDHGHSIPFIIGTTTDMPSGVVAGSRVTVYYHPVGTDRQMADRIVLLEPGVGAAPGGYTNGQLAPAPPQSTTEAPSPDVSNQPDMQLPRTASPVPLVGLVGLAAFLAGAFLRALERR